MRDSMFRALRNALWFLLAVSLSAHAQLNVIHHEGFNDDGVAAGRYSMSGRGQLIGSDGPGAWEHSFLVDAIGLPSKAPEKRAAILWTDNATEDDYTEESLKIWDNLIDFMLDGKANATVGFLPDTTSPSAEFMSFRLEEAGHEIFEFGAEFAEASEMDLVIHTSLANPPSPTDLVDFAVPVITYNAGNHDDTAVSSIGLPTTGGPTTVSIVEANRNHPVLNGITGNDVPWVDEFIDEEPLQGIGGALPAGATTLATYVDPETELVLPAILLIDKGGDLLGAFAPTPEGAGYILGGDLNLDFGDGAGSPEMPVSLTVDAIDLSGQSGVKLAVDLAATTVDFEPADFLRISYAGSASAEADDFVVLGEFQGLNDSSSPHNKSLVDPDLGALSANEFQTFTFDIPDDVDEIVVKFEAFSTFPNEILGIDNLLVFTGEPSECNPGTMGDLDGNGSVDFTDFLVLSSNFGNEVEDHTAGDIDCNGSVDFTDFLVLSTNFGQAVGARSVPEPSGAILVFVALGVLGLQSRRRR